MVEPSGDKIYFTFERYWEIAGKRYPASIPPRIIDLNWPPEKIKSEIDKTLGVWLEDYGEIAQLVAMDRKSKGGGDAI